MATTDRARWEEHFAAVIMTGNRGEIEAATRGALAALHAGADDALAKEAGRTALRHYRAQQPPQVNEVDHGDESDLGDPAAAHGGAGRRVGLLGRLRRGSGGGTMDRR